MDENFLQFWNSLIAQMPLAAVGFYFANRFINEFKTANDKLHSTFESEIKACEARYNFVLSELMKMKEKIQ